MNLHLPLYDAAVLVLASGRISYALAKDEIFRPAREAIYRYSAPHSDANVDGEPWRMIHSWKNTKDERAKGWGRWSDDFDASSGLRKVGWFGSLAECPYCLSFYTSLAALGAYLAYPGETIALLSLFAIWCVANIIAAKGLH